MFLRVLYEVRQGKRLAELLTGFHVSGHHHETTWVICVDLVYDQFIFLQIICIYRKLKNASHDLISPLVMHRFQNGQISSLKIYTTGNTGH